MYLSVGERGLQFQFSEIQKLDFEIQCSLAFLTSLEVLNANLESFYLPEVSTEQPWKFLRQLRINMKYLGLVGDSNKKEKSVNAVRKGVVWKHLGNFSHPRLYSDTTSISVASSVGGILKLRLGFLFS